MHIKLYVFPTGQLKFNIILSFWETYETLLGARVHVKYPYWTCHIIHIYSNYLWIDFYVLFRARSNKSLLTQYVYQTACFSKWKTQIWHNFSLMRFQLEHMRHFLRAHINHFQVSVNCSYDLSVYIEVFYSNTPLLWIKMHIKYHNVICSFIV